MKISVLGDGTFGTACATLLAHNGHTVTLWCYNKDVANNIEDHHVNSHYLPHVSLDKKIIPTVSFKTAFQNDLIFEAIPVAYMRSVLEECKSYQTISHRWVTLSKGIEQKKTKSVSLLLPTQIVQDILGKETICAAISGPSYAHELAQQLPTGITIASNNKNFCTAIKGLLENDFFSLEISEDLIGVQLVGALKNCIAMGIGLLDGADYGANTQILFMMRALEEIKIILRFYHCPETTIYSFAGIGDIVLTSFGKQSRNYKFGQLMGQNKKYNDTIKELGIEPEGVNTLQSLYKIIQKNNLALPLFMGLHEIIFHNGNVKKLMKLLNTNLR